MSTLVKMMGAACLALLACNRAAPPASGGAGARDSAAPAAVQGDGPVAAADAERREPTVLFVGTSLTAGFGLDDPARDAFPQQVGVLAERAGVPIRVVNAGISGETSAGALRRIDWVLRAPADVIVIETGANDGLRGLDVDSVRTNVEAILRKVRAAQPAARVLLVQMEAPPNLGSRYTTRFRELFPAVAKEYGVTLVPFLLEGVAGHPELNQSDGMHPTAAGAKVAAGTVWRVMEPVVREVEKGSVRR